MPRRYLVALFLFFASISATAQTLKSEADARKLTDDIMARVAKSDLDGAFALMKPYVVVPEAEFQGWALQSKSQRDQFGTRYGKTTGHEFIAEKKAGDSILRIVHVEKTTRHALPWMFFFYRTPEGWVLNSFAWNDQMHIVFQFL